MEKRRSLRDRQLLMPWTRELHDKAHRVFVTDPGQNWGSWAVVEEGLLVASGNHIIEHGDPVLSSPQYLPHLPQDLLSAEERSHGGGPQFDRRLYGIWATVGREMDRQVPIDIVTLYEYGQARGQYAGIAKSLAFARGLELMLLTWPEVAEFVTADSNATYDQVEAEMRNRYPDMVVDKVVYDDGSIATATPGTVIALGLTAWSRLAKQGRV